MTDFGADQEGLMIDPLSCVVDLNGDKNLDFFDISEFLSLFGTGRP